jgi:ketosteroid isomerase-like protein
VTRPQSPGFRSPEAAEAAFYAAFAATDVAAMARVWPDEGPVCVHPGGVLLLGKDAVMQSWVEILSGATPPRIEHCLISSIAAGDVQIHLVEERIWPGRDASASPSRVIATNVYSKGPGGWQLRIHHASLPLMPGRAATGSERRLH